VSIDVPPSASSSSLSDRIDSSSQSHLTPPTSSKVGQWEGILSSPSLLTSLVIDMLAVIMMNMIILTLKIPRRVETREERPRREREILYVF